MSAVHDLCDFIYNATEIYRKGEEVVEHDPVGGVKVTEVFAMPHVSEAAGGPLIDVHFILIGKKPDVPDDGTQEFIDLLIAATKDGGVHQDLTLDELMDGPSYITLGGWLGSQDIALRFIGLGAIYGLWNAVTPETLGLDGPLADEVAGNGFVMFAPAHSVAAMLKEKAEENV